MGAEPVLAFAGDRPCAISATRALGARSALACDGPPALAAEWQTLAGRAAECNCFAEPWFFAAGLRHLGSQAGVRLLEVRDGADLIGVLPLHVGRDYGRIRVSHVRNWKHHHDFLGVPLIRAGAERAFWDAAIRHLDAAPWAPGFLHLNGLVENGSVHRGLAEAAVALGREAATVHRHERALLAGPLSAEAYYETHIRKKKRKELKRLRNRLEELGPVTVRRLDAAEPLAPWADAFLALEREGWKGRAGSALANAPRTEHFFRDALCGARRAGRLDFLRIDLGPDPVAMLVNFVCGPGGFSFKIAFDERFARFSPGVLIELENLALLDRPGFAWMDSCAAENHNMIDSLWAGRRAIVRVSVPLSGLRRAATYRMCRALERASAARRALLDRPA